MHTTELKAAPSRAALWLLVVLIAVAGTLVSATLLGAPGSDSNFSPGGDSGAAPQPSESSDPDVGEPPTGNPDSGRTSIFAEADQRMSEMVETRAEWHAPSQSPVAETI